VLSHAENATSAQSLTIGFSIHTVCMLLGTWLAAWGARAKQVAKAA
jgi:ABC-type spermidine/putrescine transport system permease subunit II